MAKLYIKKQPDGRYRLRAQRMAGKELAAHQVVANVQREDFGTAVKILMDTVAPPRRGKTVI